MIISSSPLIDDEVFFRPTISKMQCITALDARKMLNCIFFRTSLNNFLIRKMRLFSSHLKAGTFKSVTDGFMILLRLFQRVIKWFEKCFTGGVCSTAFLNGCRVDSCGQPQPLKMLTPTCFSALFSNFFDLHLMLLTDLPFEKGGTPPSLSSLMLAVKVVAFEVFSSIRWQFRFENICSISILHEKLVRWRLWNYFSGFSMLSDFLSWKSWRFSQKVFNHSSDFFSHFQPLW